MRKRINVQRDLNSRRAIENPQLPQPKQEVIISNSSTEKSHAESKTIQASEVDESSNIEKSKKGGRKTKGDVQEI